MNNKYTNGTKQYQRQDQYIGVEYEVLNFTDEVVNPFFDRYEGQTIPAAHARSQIEDWVDGMENIKRNAVKQHESREKIARLQKGIDALRSVLRNDDNKIVIWMKEAPKKFWGMLNYIFDDMFGQRTYNPLPLTKYEVPGYLNIVEGVVPSSRIRPMEVNRGIPKPQRQGVTVSPKWDKEPPRTEWGISREEARRQEKEREEREREQQEQEKQEQEQELEQEYELSRGSEEARDQFVGIINKRASSGGTTQGVELERLATGQHGRTTSGGISRTTPPKRMDPQKISRLTRENATSITDAIELSKNYDNKQHELLDNLNTLKNKYELLFTLISNINNNISFKEIEDMIIIFQDKVGSKNATNSNENIKYFKGLSKNDNYIILPDNLIENIRIIIKNIREIVDKLFSNRDNLNILAVGQSKKGITDNLKDINKYRNDIDIIKNMISETGILLLRNRKINNILKDNDESALLYEEIFGNEKTPTMEILSKYINDHDINSIRAKYLSPLAIRRAQWNLLLNTSLVKRAI